MGSVYFLQVKLFLMIFLNLNIVAYLVVPMGWCFLPAEAGYFFYLKI